MPGCDRLQQRSANSNNPRGGFAMATSHRLDHNPFIVQPGKKIRLKDFDPSFTGEFKDKAAAQQALLEDVSGLAAAQDVLWASKQYGIIIILQALDAAGKDGTIEHVMSGVNPQGVVVHSFKAPSDEERMHHFLWRPMQAMPRCGQIAIFNRSYYEEVLVVRVHPEFLESQWLPTSQQTSQLDHIWRERYAEINQFEEAAHRGDYRILKFFLNVSKEEQRKRFLERINNPEKNWKFSSADVRERRFWDQYQEAYEEMLNATSTEVAPWYVIPADKKWFARACVADIITSRIEKLDLKYPKLSDKEYAALDDAKRELENE
jgi:PPK2 family polyphosphate:nucleotide phosphotransferase